MREKQRDHRPTSGSKGSKRGRGEEWGRPQAAPTVPQGVSPPPVRQDRWQGEGGVGRPQAAPSVPQGVSPPPVRQDRR